VWLCVGRLEGRRYIVVDACREFHSVRGRSCEDAVWVETGYEMRIVVG